MTLQFYQWFWFYLEKITIFHVNKLIWYLFRAKQFWLYSSSLKVKWSVPNWNNYSSSLFCVNTTVPKSSKNILLILNEIPHSPFTWHILFWIEMKIKTNIYHYIDNNSEFANLNRIHIKFEYIAMMRSRYGKWNRCLIRHFK